MFGLIKAKKFVTDIMSVLEGDTVTIHDLCIHFKIITANLNKNPS